MTSDAIDPDPLDPDAIDPDAIDSEIDPGDPDLLDPDPDFEALFAELPEIDPRAAGQRLPPLQGLPETDPARLRRFLKRESDRYRTRDLSELPPWGEEHQLTDEARRRLLLWVRGAAKRTGQPILDLGGGAGRLLHELTGSPTPVVGLQRFHNVARSAAAFAQRSAAAAHRAAEAEARTQSQRSISWWAGNGIAPRPPRLVARKQPPARLVVGDPLDPPFEPESFGSVVAFDVLQQLSDWPSAVRAWARLLGPGASLVIATTAEKDQDEPGFLSLLGRTLRPGAVSGFPRSQDLTWVVGSVDLEVQAASVLRVRRTFEELEAEAARSPGAEPGACRALCDRASESLRALYDIDEEGLSWRYMLLTAERPTT